MQRTEHAGITIVGITIVDHHADPVAFLGTLET
jgi:hypothetical protein